MENYEFKNRPGVDSTIVAKNLPRSKDLSVRIAQFFSKCGAITSIELEDEMRGKEEVSKALITFKERKFAEEALRMQSHRFEGRSLEMDWAYPNVEGFVDKYEGQGPEGTSAMMGGGGLFKRKSSGSTEKHSEKWPQGHTEKGVHHGHTEKHSEKWPQGHTEKGLHHGHTEKAPSDSMKMEEGMENLLQSSDSQYQMKLGKDMRELWRPEQGNPDFPRTYSESTILMDKDVGELITLTDTEYQKELGQDMRGLWRPEQEELELPKKPKTTTVITTTTTHGFEPTPETRPETTKEKFLDKVHKLKEKFTGEKEETEPLITPEQRAKEENKEVHNDVVHKLMEKLHPSSTTTETTSTPHVQTEEYPGHNQKVMQAAERDAAFNQEQPASPRI